MFFNIESQLFWCPGGPNQTHLESRTKKFHPHLIHDRVFSRPAPVARCYADSWGPCQACWSCAGLVPIMG